MPDPELLGKKLDSSDPEERREATVDLGRSGRSAVPFLFRALADSDWRVRKTAVESLVGFADESVVSGLIQSLFLHDNAGARNSAIEALVQIGPGAVPHLLQTVRTLDPDVRKFIVDILGDIRDPNSVPPLIELLRDPDENVRVAAAEALGKTRDRRAVEALLSCLTRSDLGWLDYAAAEALGEIGDQRALAPLLAALERSSLREPVLESLGKIGNVYTLTPLIAGLEDPLRLVREVSTNALVAIYRKSTGTDRETIFDAVRAGASDRAVVFLEDMLLTSAGELQKAAVAVLGWAGREGSIRKMLALLKEEDMEEPMIQALCAVAAERLPLLLEFLDDDNALIRRTVARVLGRRGRHEAEDHLIALLEDENGHVRSSAAEALGHLRCRKAAPVLVALLTDEYESVQESAIRALGEIGDESVLTGLVKDFTSREANLRKNIALLLGRFSSEQALDALSFALKDEESSVRKAVVQAMGSLSGERAERALMLAVTDDDAEVRMLAAEALGRSELPHAADTLIPLLEDPDMWVRAAAVRGLGKIGGERIARVLSAYLPVASDLFLLALVEVLGRMKAEQAFDGLLGLAGHHDPEVRKSVLGALAGYAGKQALEAISARISDPHWSVRKTAIELLSQNRDAAADRLLATIADEDPDGAVRQAAREALEK